MKTRYLVVLLAALMVLMSPATARAGEALEPLRGAWTAQSIAGEVLPAGTSMAINFIDDQYVEFTLTQPEQEPTKSKVRYRATADGGLVLFPNPEHKPEGNAGKWEVKDDGKLYITTAEKQVLIFARPAS